MAWDFETEPAFQQQLDWMDVFVREEIEPIGLVWRKPTDPFDVHNKTTRALIKPLQEEVRKRGLWACHLTPDLGGQGYGQVKLALMNEILGRSSWASRVFGTQAPDTGNAEIIAHYGTAAQKARYLGDFIANVWDELDRPCSERAVERAIVFAQTRDRAFDPATSVLVHGDAHAANTLQIVGPRSGNDSGFKFVDPDGMRAERACDLAVPMREWSEVLLSGDALQAGLARCALISRLTGVDPEAIWQWGFLERMSTGLYLLQLGWEQLGRDMLTVADTWAQIDGPRGHRS